jgi:hypothetical protein
MASLPAKSQFLAEADLSSCLFAVVPGPHEEVPGCEKRPMLEGLPIPPRECIEVVQWMLLESAQRKLESLMAEKRTVQCVLGTERNLLVVLWPLQEAPGAAYDREYLPVLSSSRPLARLYLLESHCKDHDGQDSMVMQSRSQI